MTQIRLTTPQNPLPNFKLTTTFASFDKLKTAGAHALEPIQKGSVAKLETKNGQYVILEESDFQQLYGLAQEIRRLSLGLDLVLSAVQAVEEHQDKTTVTTLIKAVRMVGNVAILPTQSGHHASLPEGLDVEEDNSINWATKQITPPI
jgi:hypothetical protein